MLRVLGQRGAACDGVSRRELLHAGALSLFGALGLPGRSRARPGSNRQPGAARSVILLDLFGGPSHLDTFDPKPAAPAEIRGEFKPIATSLPGVLICEYLPRIARWMHRLCLIRTVAHDYNSHNPYAVMTGFTGGNDAQDYFSRPNNHPSMGSVCQYAGLGNPGMPPYVLLPAFPGYTQGLRRAGPYGGYLGTRFNPLFSTCDPRFDRPVDEDKDAYNHTIVPMGEPTLPTLAPGQTIDAMDRRRSLLSQLDAQAAAAERSSKAHPLGYLQRQAFELLLSSSARTAFDLGQEPVGMRERYGRDLFGSSMLLARRLVEAGVTFVTVHTEAKGSGHWDTHENNFNMLKHSRLPFLDRAVSVLLEDLEARGLLDSTLLVVMGDMGRTPRVNAKAGRDHWPRCGFCLLAGAGLKAGIVHGTSDRQGAYPNDHPVSPGDIVASIYHLVGVDPEMTAPDLTGRPISIAHGGQPIWDVIAANQR
ncbi:MAG: DUF1501 domain-containing protein [Planctomycetes bacterium]|nr:DUF1501 domain-containing protein [Planctomycetota bacterium]